MGCGSSSSEDVVSKTTELQNNKAASVKKSNQPNQLNHQVSSSPISHTSIRFGNENSESKKLMKVDSMSSRSSGHDLSSDNAKQVRSSSLIRRFSIRNSIGSLFGKLILPPSPLLQLFDKETINRSILIFLTTCDIAQFDRACLNHAFRRSFSNALYTLQYVSIRDICLSTKLIQWLTTRNLSTRHLFMDSLQCDDISSSIASLPYPSMMKSIIFDSCNILSTTSILKVIQNFSYINYLSLQYCTFVSDADITVICSYCPNIQYLNVCGCANITDLSIEAVCNQYDIIELDISYCRRITDLSLELISEKCGTYLETLILTECRKISDVGLHALSLHCAQIQVISLSWCNKITDTGLIDLVKTCSNCTSISLCGLKCVTDNGMVSLLQACPQLEYLNLRLCSKITDATTAAMAYHSPKLQCLILSECRLISDESIGALAYGCPLLRALYVSECVLLTDAAISALAFGCKRLNLLDVSYCPNITNVAVDSLLQQNTTALRIFQYCFQKPDNPDYVTQWNFQ